MVPQEQRGASTPPTADRMRRAEPLAAATIGSASIPTSFPPLFRIRPSTITVSTFAGVADWTTVVLGRAAGAILTSFVLIMMPSALLPGVTELVNAHRPSVFAPLRVASFIV